MRPVTYVLDDRGEPVPYDELDFPAWLDWYRCHDKGVALTVLGVEPPLAVSTVFLALDHQSRGVGPPLLYETWIFGGPLAGGADRYSTRAEALAGHDRIVAFLRSSGGRPAPRGPESGNPGAPGPAAP